MKRIFPHAINWLLYVKIGFIVAALTSSGCIADPRIIPQPDPIVVPVVAHEFRCLILEETADRTKLPPTQLAIFTSVKIRDYMDTHAEDKNGDTAFRVYDKDLLASIAKERPASLGTSSWVVPVKENPPQSYPWLYCTNGTKGFSGPLPKSVDEFLATIKPYSEP